MSPKKPNNRIPPKRLKTTTRVWGEIEIGNVSLSVELCTTYWHYLLLVWLVLFGLLLST